jgi:hypothetical protein
MAVEPTIAVQFRNSALINSTSWNDKGHEDCLIELNQMIRSFLPPATIAGLKRATFSTGQNFMKGDPSMISLECEKSSEPIVTRDILQAFRSVNRKFQLRDKCSVPWTAVPYFKGGDIQSNPKYLTQYVDIKTKEATYQSGIIMKYLDCIHSLDTVAPQDQYLSGEVLKQLEQDIWDHNETPVRALVYDKLWDETLTALAQQKLRKKKTPSKKEISEAKTSISFHEVLDEMAKKGYPTLAPFDEQSFPIPNPSKRTLREFLMTMKARRIEDAEKAPFLFESINKTDDGRVLVTFSKATMEEATTVLDCLPLVIQHEMHIDPTFFLSTSFVKLCQGSYYNPLSRTGVTTVAAFLEDEIKTNKNPKHRIPKAIQNATAQEMELLFKRKENRMFTFHDDSDLASLANSIASYHLPELNIPKNIENISSLQTLLQTHHINSQKDEEVSALSDSSDLSFDSKASRNRYEIERRTDQIASQKADDKMFQLKLKQGLALLASGQLTHDLVAALELPSFEIIQEYQLSLQHEPPSDRNTTPSIPTEPSQDTDLKHNNENPIDIELPASDMSEEDSTATPVRGSPSKLMAADSQNVGSVK